MISGIIYDRDETERKKLVSNVRDGIAKRTDDESRISECDSRQAFVKSVRATDINDFCCMDFKAETGRENAMVLRNIFPDSALLLVVDMTVSPREYVRPDIMPSAIVLRPSDDESLRQTVDEFMDSIIKSEDTDDKDSFSITAKEGVTKIRFEQILYVEASAKKVYIRTKKEEYGYYDTLDSLEESLPDYFCRCHRGYIVNLHKVNRYVGAESSLYLADGSVLPVSRSYKAAVREALK